MIRRWLLLLLAVALLCWPGAARAQDEAPPLDTYLALLREASAAAQRSDRLGLETVAEQLLAITSVQVGDDQARVDNRWLEQALASNDPNFDQIAERLGAIINALTLPDNATPADALARLEQILNNPPFQDQPPADNSGWFYSLMLWLGRILDAIFRPVGSVSSAGAEVVAWVIAVVGGLLLVGVIVYLLLGLRRTMAQQTQVEDDDPEANLTAKTALDQASDLARGGDHRTAMRYLYLSALLWLDERGMLRYDRALTNREYLTHVRGNPTLYGKLAPIVDTFDRVWYGHVPLDDAAFAAYKAQVEALRNEVRS